MTLGAWHSGALGAAALLASVAMPESAQPEIVNVRPDADVVVAADPVLGSSLPERGIGEIVVRVENHHDHPLDGRIEVHAAAWGATVVEAAAELHVDASGTAL